MTIYFILITVILFLYLANKNSVKALGFVFLCIFLISALRAPSVGRDFPGYIRAYEMTKDIPFSNFTYIYFENGYVLFMKICALMGLSNQLFTAITSFIIILPVYMFIKKYSKNYMLSALIYVSYQMFEFHLTGIRQSMAMSIGLIAFIVLTERKRGWILKYLLLSICAISFHNGAFIILFALPIVLVKSIKKVVVIEVISSGAVLLLRGSMLSYIKELFGKKNMVETADLYIGSNLLFIIGICILVFWVVYRNQKYIEGVGESWVIDNTKLFMLSIPFTFLFGAETSVRSVMFMTQLIVVLLPETLALFDRRSQKIMRVIYAAFFVIFFITDTVLPNNFDIIPYTFYWNEL